jgi:hypothetical protein
MGYNNNGQVGDGREKDAALNSSKIVSLGNELSLTAYNINNANSFKLREIGATFNFTMAFDDAANSIMIDTSKPYTD